MSAGVTKCQVWRIKGALYRYQVGWRGEPWLRKLSAGEPIADQIQVVLSLSRAAWVMR
jgi:hypothetical protein